jgi:hypothetical protein
VIINNLNLERITVVPNETETILIVDSDAVLTLPIAPQSFKVISGKDRQVAQSMGRV